jgi:drug/metabolite transporter (DMT)-like permease
MIGAMVSFTLMAVAGRALSATLDTFEIMMYRSFIGFSIVIGLAIFQGQLSQISANRLSLHTLRNLFHFAGQNLWFYALVYIPLSQLFAFEFTNPLWLAVLAPFFLGEKMSRTRIFAFVLGFIGILIVARPETAPITFATFAAAACALMFSFTTICTKHLGRTETTFSILFWLTTIQGVLGILCAGYDFDIAVPVGSQIIWVFVVGLCGLLAHFCITIALKLAPATIVSPMDFLRLPLVAVVAWFLYGEPIVAAVFVGAAIVIAANILNIRAEHRANLAKVETTP